MSRKDLEAWVIRLLLSAIAYGAWTTYMDVQLMKRDWQWMHGDSHAPEEK